LAGLAHDVRPRLRGPLAARVTALCRYLFHELGFHGNTQDYYDPRNSYFNEVLERRTGLPITLSLVAMSIGTRAGLTIHGVGLPGHFIAKAVAPTEEPAEVLFDPFHGGRLLTPPQCEALVKQVTGHRFRATPEALTVATSHAIIVRLLTNLKGIYLRTGDFLRGPRIIHRLCQLLPNDPVQQRDLGVTLAQSGQPGQALEHLEAYLHAAPEAPDREAVQQFLQQVRGEIAKWN
jgi:regulator of sirC expression with transglutaminase-like and TPR domain